ncbi:MAG: DNA-directed RNA polymerase subunit beta [Rhodospirillaceae bacterium]|jgi:DNA-directed RNA polymerase subunit beta|nr:DNA-directed RNA polymerase subunit beta [Rhodospirillaceae bacterium]
MAESYAKLKNIRKNFGRIPSIIPIPNMIEVQKSSYERFLQMYTSPEMRIDSGLQEIFKSVFPIKDFAERGVLEFVKYEFESPKYDVEECQQRGMTFAAPLRVTLRLLIWDIDEETNARSIRDIKEQSTYMGDIPLMTTNGTFVINGVERVIVSQMHRSPGVFFDHDNGKTHSSGKYLFVARIIPYRGSWLDFEFDAKDILYFRIDRRRKLPVTTLLYALDSEETVKLREKADNNIDNIPSLGMSSEEILNYFYNNITYSFCAYGWKTAFNIDRIKGTKLTHDLIDAKTGKIIVKANTKITPRTIKKLLDSKLSEIIVLSEDLIGSYLSQDIVDEETGEIFCEVGEELTLEMLNFLETKSGEVEVSLLTSNDYTNTSFYIRNTLAIDKNTCREDALADIYRVMRPGEPPTLETAENLFKGLFFNSERYDLSIVGRVKMNSRLSFTDVPNSIRTLRKEDLLRIIKVLIDLRDGKGDIDDIDHLGNRHIRSAGELMENQYLLGLQRMERVIRERMSSADISIMMPHDLINIKPVIVSIREFFGSSQLSQFMDQTNPLSEITHKRRLSALGPGGLTRERAGFEVRDVHPTHYGRICPIETPEGQNIGLINSLATYAKINKYGFIESPYRRVINGMVTDEVLYLSAIEEEHYAIAQANAPLNNEGYFIEDLISCRRNNDFVLIPATEINFIDVSPKQLVSVAAALIPFLENDDANRALMGSNMQRQAVPLLHAKAPLIGTGIESDVARDSGAMITAKRSGVVDHVDATRIVVRAVEETSTMVPGVDIYNLMKFQRSNQSTCINQRPLVRVGDYVSRDDVIADGTSTQFGELALGRNVLVAFMSWNGYNFEDSILISDRLVRDDVFTSIHIEEFEIMARDTKLGQEEITRDIPNIGDESLRLLDEVGIVYVGAEVNSGDIMVGKVTPKSESPITPEEKLLRAIFGEKALDVRDTSLRLPLGMSGVVTEVRVFSRRGVKKDERAITIERVEIERLAKDRDDERLILERSFYDRLKNLLINQIVINDLKKIKVGSVLTENMLTEINKSQWRSIVVESDVVMSNIEALKLLFDECINRLQKRFENKVEKLQDGDDLPPGVMKIVKVFVAMRRHLQPGDKMAGRHGNKGVISRIMPIEDMPHLENGQAVDLVLNPLGVLSRMNIGQILETHLGWASANLGRQIGEIVDGINHQINTIHDLRDRFKCIYGEKNYQEDIVNLTDSEILEMGSNMRSGVPMSTPVFDGANESDIVKMLKQAGLDSSGQITLIDGRTGEKFDRKVTVGYIYMLKLHHLVDEKIHARSIGPYSLVTQQPLGGRAHFGGQRFGEMEVWALESYGAAYTLQEMLTVKSDDVSGRTKIYEAIVRGSDFFESGVPESFNVLVKELRSLGLNIEFNQRNY